MRASLASAFTPRHANRLRPLMREVIGSLLDQWTSKSKFDFVDFASHFPIAVMCGVLGISSDRVRQVHQAIEAQILCLTMDRKHLPEIFEGYEVLRSFTADVIREREQRKVRDTDMLLDALIETKDTGGLDENELRDLVITLLLAGYDTSKNELALVMHALIKQLDMLERCAADRDFCTKVVQETLRHTSVATPSRTVFETFEYDGIVFPQGTQICFAVALSGRDPAAYDDPMAFLPERTHEVRHLAFGRGTHICLGQFLATAILEEGLHLIAQRMKRPRLAGEVTWRPFRAGIWGIRSLPIAVS
jgi:cytochrome P450